MLVKIVSFFLIGMAVLAMFGKLRLPGQKLLGKTRLQSKKCPKCGRFQIGKGPCPCRKNMG
ncbi:hypothetical protein [Shimia sp.]|uniref:hypothetical protein n=1 Tax=Shimia sp. TaxID=1954381 RepID=UPI003BA87EA1